MLPYRFHMFIDGLILPDLTKQIIHLNIDMNKTVEEFSKSVSKLLVLIYLSVSDKKFAIIGDAGIHQHVKDDFWNKIKDEMVEHFRNEKFDEGLIHAIHEAGKVLQKYFPYNNDDKNELSNDLEFGGEG